MRRFPIAQFRDFPKELAALKKLRTPAEIQGFLNKIPFNHEEQGETYASPVVVLRRHRAHCMEGALLAAAALWLHGQPPLILDLKTVAPDVDHVVTLFKEGNRWGAISKTNHGVLRYRDPIYRDPREIVMSYFNEYFLDSGVKTLRSFSQPFDLSRLGGEWLTADRELDDIALALDRSPHTPIMSASAARNLRRADPVEIRSGEIVEWKKKKIKK